MNALFARIILPCGVIGRNINALEPVPSDNIKLSCTAVILRRIAGGHDYPAAGNAVSAKGFVLQKLQHGGGEGFGHAVYLIKEQNALINSAFLHHVVDCGDYLAHGVFRDLVPLAAILLFNDQRQTKRTLSGVMGHGVAEKPHAQLRGNLAHNGGLADARRPHEKHRSLCLRRYDKISVLVFGKISAHCIFDLLLCLGNVHSSSSSSTPLPDALAFKSRAVSSA